MADDVAFEKFYPLFIPGEMMLAIYRVMLEVTSSGVLAVNTVGRIVFCDESLANMFGYETKECIGQKVEMFLPDNITRIHEASRVHYQEKPTPRKMGEGRTLMGKKKDGSLLQVEVALNDFTYKGAKFIAAVVQTVSK
jgi:two-component system sensor histidine kinase DevS